jgi:hypothetical protein
LDALACRQRHSTLRVPPHIEKRDDCFGQFLVRVICDCGGCREIEAEALDRSGRLASKAEAARASGCSIWGYKARAGLSELPAAV